MRRRRDRPLQNLGKAEKSAIRSSFNLGEPVMVKSWTGSVLRGSLLQQSDH